MSLATLDTHEVLEDLLTAGFSDAPAEAARNPGKAQDLDTSIGFLTLIILGADVTSIRFIQP